MYCNRSILFSVQCLGKVGTVKLIHPSRDTVIYVSGRMWVFNPLCLTPAPGEVPDGGEGEAVVIH